MSKKKKHPKLPNGYGSIQKLSGNRRNSYAVYPPTTHYTEEGKVVRPKALCYVSDWYIGLAILTAYKAGTYKLTGTLQTKEGITIPEEFRKVTVNVTVEEKGKVPPTSGKEEGKNNSGAVQTGDDKNVWLPIAGLVAAIAVVAAVLIIKNKKKK